MKYLFWTLIGYLSGSILYACLIPMHINHINICEVSDDGNPGTANVFKYAGFPAGCLVICMELLKAFVPVFTAARMVDPARLPFAFVMAAPVLGHAFPFMTVMRSLFHMDNDQKGGKAIAASFGVVLALFPELYPFAALAFFYILFSTVIVIKPHFFRSILTFCLFTLTVFFKVAAPSVRLGCLIISAVTVYKHISRYHGEKLEVKLFRHLYVIR